MVMFPEKNTGQNQSIKICNKSFEWLEQLKYLGTNLTNQDSFQEEIKGRLKSGNASYHSVQKLLSYSLLSKNIKITIYRTVIHLLFSMGATLVYSY
jgi:hypothetical protein